MYGLKREAYPYVIEEWDLIDGPVRTHEEIMCVANALKGRVTFEQGKELPDTHRSSTVCLMRMRKMIKSEVAYNFSKRRK